MTKPPMAKPIEVEVYGQRLVLRGDAEEGYVRELARYVEEQMSAVAQGLTNVTPAKLAILAALNIADQLFQGERRRQAGEAEIQRRAEDLLECIDAQLQEHHKDIESEA